MALSNRSILFIVVGIILLVSAFVLLRNCTGTPVVLVTETDSVQYWKNKAGQLVGSVIKSQDDFAKANFKIDSLAKLLKVKPKSILSSVEAITHGQDTLQNDHKPLITYRRDSTTHCPPQIQMLQETFWNDYYTADVTIDANGDSSTMKIQSTDTAYLTWRKISTGNIFHRKHFIELDATNANPNNKIVGLHGYKRAEPKPKKIGIGIQGGYGFSKGFQPQPYIGVGITYTLIRL